MSSSSTDLAKELKENTKSNLYLLLLVMDKREGTVWQWVGGGGGGGGGQMHGGDSCLWYILVLSLGIIK